MQCQTMYYTPTGTPDLYARFNGISNNGPRALETLSPSPIPWLPLQECANSSKITLVSEEVRLLAVFGPKADGV